MRTARVPSAVAAAPLAGLRVVELGFAANGPLVGKYLANHGAEVIRVESRRILDVFRTTYPPFKGNEMGVDRAGMFAFYNDGKRGVTLDLKHPEGLRIARRLIASADVFVESFTGGTAERIGLGYQTLRAESPGLVMLSTCSQGQTGPRAHLPGFGSQLSALPGFINLLGERDRDPVHLYGPYIDYIAVGYGVIAILAALARRRATGRGSYIDLSMYEAGLQFMAPALLEFQANGVAPTRDGNRDRVAVPHGVYPCRAPDSWIALSVWDDGEWRRFAGIVGAAWSRAPRFATVDGRRAHEAELDRRIAEWTRDRTRDEVVRYLRATGLRAAPVETIPELFSDPQLAHRGFWRALPHPVLGSVRCLAAPFLLSETPARFDRAGPLLGADNRYVFGQVLGIQPDELARLEAAGVFE